MVKGRNTPEGEGGHIQFDLFQDQINPKNKKQVQVLNKLHFLNSPKGSPAYKPTKLRLLDGQNYWLTKWTIEAPKQSLK